MCRQPESSGRDTAECILWGGQINFQFGSRDTITVRYHHISGRAVAGSLLGQRRVAMGNGPAARLEPLDGTPFD